MKTEPDVLDSLEKPKVGISTCLLGFNVRYNAGNKLDHYLRDVLGKYVEYVPVCPEVEAGFGTPREAINLHLIDSEMKVITQHSKKDLTTPLVQWSKREVKELGNLGLCGYIFKSKSPSCGVYRTRVYRENQSVSLDGRGVYADLLIEAFPDLTVEEEGRLHNPVLRDNFIENVFITHRWNKLLEDGSIKGLMKFHQNLKYTLMSHSPEILKEMGSIAANSNSKDKEEVYKNYYMRLKQSLQVLCDRKKHRNVLDHIRGYFKNYLDSDEKHELSEVIENYYRGLLPLIVPVTLLNHYARKYKDEYLLNQFYLNPHPLELMLRNHI